MSQGCTCANTDDTMAIIDCNIHGYKKFVLNINNSASLIERQLCGCLILNLAQGRAILLCKDHNEKIEEFLR